MATAHQPDLTAALDRLWTRFLPEIRERTTILESAGAALAAGTLAAEQREAAHAAAHKLAGILGTFNLHTGTELARELEQIYSGGEIGSPEASRAAALAAELRGLVENRG